VTDFGTDFDLAPREITLPMPDGSTRTWTTFDFAEDFGLVSGLTLVAQALVRRIVTPRGTLPDPLSPTGFDPLYGTDVRRWLNEDVDATRIAGQIAAEIDTEFQKDPRVKKSTTTTTFDGTTATSRTTVITADGPFALVLAISAVSVEVLEAPR
jgi:hypothetical protein